MELNKALQSIGLGESRQNKTLSGHEAPHHSHAQEIAAMCDVDVMTEADASPTPQPTYQTTESSHPQHSPAISKAVENALHDLSVVIMAWPRLPDSMRKGIIAMVQAASSQDYHKEQ